MEPSETRIVGTVLSDKPRDESVAVALLFGMAISFASMMCWRDPDMAGLLSASRQQIVAGGAFWKLITTIVVHADLAHLGANVPFVVFFGYLLYGYFGVWVYPVTMLLLASVAHLLALLTYPPGAALIGSSGLVYVMLGFWLALYALIERTLSFRKRLLRVAGIALIVLVPTTVQPEVSYRTHFIGWALGSVAGIAYFVFRKKEIRSRERVELDPLTDGPGEWKAPR